VGRPLKDQSVKRFASVLIIILLAALVLTPAGVSAAPLAQTTGMFHIPDDYPLDGPDWSVVDDIHATLTDLGPDYADCASTAVDFIGCYFVLPFDEPMHVDSWSFTLSGSGTMMFSIYVCPTTGHTSLYSSSLGDCSGIPWHTESAGDFESVDFPEATGPGMEIVFGYGFVGTGTAELRDFELFGGPGVVRPVLEVDVVDELDIPGLPDDAYPILTQASARVFAVSDAVVGDVIHDSNGYFVALIIGEDIVYYSSLSSVFATAGMEIHAGCVLGYTSVPPPGSPTGTGYFLYTHDEDLTDWHDWSDSLSNAPCDQPDSNCINPNPDFNSNGLGWFSRNQPGTVYLQGSDSWIGVTYQGQIYQTGFNVAVEDTYYVTLVVNVGGAAHTGAAVVTIGGTSSTIPINTFGAEFVSVTSPALSPAVTGVSEFQISNNFAKGHDLRITFACLHVGDVKVAPPLCYFADAELITDSFETEGGATFEESVLGAGRYSIPAGGVIRSPVDITAYADEDKDFTLAIQAAAPDGATDVTASIVDSDTDDELQAIGNYAYSSILWVNLTKTFTVPSSTSLVGDLYIENTGDETVLISSLCMSPVDRVWAGYENPDHAGGLLPTNCEECALPESFVDVVAWLNYLACVFRYLIYCLLYQLVNTIWDTLVAVGSGLGLLGRWMSRNVSILAVWLWAAMGRILASLLGNAIPLLNAILAWLLTLPFVRDVLDSLAIVDIWVDGIFTLINNIFILFGRTIQFIYVLFNTFGIAWTAFFDALSASPEITVVLPDCTDPETPFYDACLVFDVLNYVLAAVPALGLLGAALVVKISWNRIRQASKGLEAIFSI